MAFLSPSEAIPHLTEILTVGGIAVLVVDLSGEGDRMSGWRMLHFDPSVHKGQQFELRIHAIKTLEDGTPCESKVLHHIVFSESTEYGKAIAMFLDGAGADDIVITGDNAIAMFADGAVVDDVITGKTEEPPSLPPSVYDESLALPSLAKNNPRPTPEKVAQSLVIHNSIILFGPLVLAIAPPAVGAWLMLKILGGILALVFVGGFISRSDFYKNILGSDAYEKFWIVAGCYTIALFLKSSPSSLVFYAMAIFFHFTIIPAIATHIKQQREK